MMDTFERFAGCILGGAIGDAYGGQFEHQEKPPENLFVWGGKEAERRYFLSDDTQLTLASLEGIMEAGKIEPEVIAKKFVSWYESGKLSGLGSATLQAIQGIRNGGHWFLVGKKGEHAAGNGSAMRMAPLAFAMKEIDRNQIRDLSRITHHNEEAYAGSLAIVLCIRSILEEAIESYDYFLEKIGNQLPDSLVRDRTLSLAKLPKESSIASVARQYGNTAYVVESVPFAIYAFVKSRKIGFEQAILEIIDSGGDTDTNASLMGQMAGTALGQSQLPQSMLNQIQTLQGYPKIQEILSKWKGYDWP